MRCGALVITGLVALTTGATALGQAGAPAPGRPPGGNAQVAAPAGSPERGRQRFREYVCYYCHGTEGQGSRPAIGPRIAGTPRSFESFSRYVRQPSGRMSPYSGASVPDAALADIYAFLRAQPGMAAAATLPLLEQLKPK
ncbi:MAG: cytochrome c [Vicinamibacterales bacterium]